MSQKELSRLDVIQTLCQRQITQKHAAQQLTLSTRQVRRLVRAYQQVGHQALISKKRNKPSNNQCPQNVISQALSLLTKDYQGFGPTFAKEKLKEHHQITLSVETLRQLMITHQLWKPKQCKYVKHHQTRARRPCFGELIQIDGSPHDWFEGRSASCCLIVFIDDATSRLLYLQFVSKETTQAYFDGVRHCLKRYGRPIAYYSDKHSIFRINTPEAQHSTGETQFGRACRELDIELICAHSPQAKGRVERANKTLQDRLVKEMRLKKIDSMVKGNAYLDEFIDDYNKRFAISAASDVDAHRKTIPRTDVCDAIFCYQVTRKLSKNLELSYKNVLYQIQTQSENYAMRGANVTICDNAGDIHIIYKGHCLDYKTIDKSNRPAPTIDTKALNKHLDNSVKHKPAMTHPWRNYSVRYEQLSMD